GRPRLPDELAYDDRATRSCGRRPRSYRRLVRSERADGGIRGREFHSRGVSRHVQQENIEGETMVDLAPQAALQAEAAARPSVRRYYVLGLLTVIYALNFLDRIFFYVLIEPIKKEFALSDTTVGWVAGFGFVLFYSLLGIPLARLADRFNRRNI